MYDVNVCSLLAQNVYVYSTVYCSHKNPSRLRIHVTWELTLYAQLNVFVAQFGWIRYGLALATHTHKHQNIVEVSKTKENTQVLNIDMQREKKT